MTPAPLFPARRMICILAISVIALLSGSKLQAQTISYSFTYFTDEVGYHDLTGDSTISNSAWGAGGMMGFNYADWEIPLGFNFQFFEETTNKMFVLRDAAALSTRQEPDSFGNTIPYNILIPFSMLLCDKAWVPYLHYMPGVVYDSTHPGFAPLSPISYKMDGMAPNRIAKIQYKNVGFVADTTGLAYINFQVWLYEDSNIIEFRYGPQYIDPSIFSPNTFNDSGLFQGSYVCLNNNHILGDCSSSGRVFEVNGPADAPALYYRDYPTSPSLSPWPYLYQVPPNRMVYRFAPYVDSSATPIDSTSTTSVQGTSAVRLQFSVTPNPASDVISINHAGIIDGTVTLFDINGKVIWQKELAAADKVNISSLAVGTYFVRLISSDRKLYTTRFLKK